MKIKLNQKGIGHLLLIFMVIFLVLHILVLNGGIPPSIIWDSTITDKASMVISETIAFLFIFLFIFGLLLKLDYIPTKLLKNSADTILWIMILYLLLNIIGCFMSDDIVKKLFYTPVIFIVVLLTLRLIFSSPSPKYKKRKPKK
ncbi:MAG: hypothetical protein RR310_00160 [Eubacterium sp.]